MKKLTNSEIIDLNPTSFREYVDKMKKRDLVYLANFMYGYIVGARKRVTQ